VINEYFFKMNYLGEFKILVTKTSLLKLNKCVKQYILGK
jgi:hypothetical protein